MKSIKKYLQKELDGVMISEKELEIIKTLIDFHLYGKCGNLDKLNDQRITVRHLLDNSFYKQLKCKIDDTRIQKSLKAKENMLNITKTLLSQDINYYQELSDITGVEIPEIEKVFRSKKLFLEYDNEVYIELGKRILKIEENEKSKNKRMQKLKTYDEFLAFYLNSRHRCGVTGDKIQNTLHNFIKDIEENDFANYYPEDILEQLSARGEELKRLKPGKNFVAIRDSEIIKIVKPEINKVTSYEHSKLELVIEFFKYNGNIEEMAKTSKYFFGYNSILSSLMLKNLEVILTEEAYEKLENYLEIEKQYQTITYRNRLDLVKNMVDEFFFKYNGNLFALMEKHGNEELVLRLLSDKLVIKCFEKHGEVMSERISLILEEYRDKEYVFKTLKKVKTPNTESV